MEKLTVTWMHNGQTFTIAYATEFDAKRVEQRVKANGATNVRRY